MYHHLMKPHAVSPQVAYFQFSLDKLNEAIKQGKVNIFFLTHTYKHTLRNPNVDG